MAKRTKRLIEESQEDDSIRINKYLSDAGVCSRREADRFIQSGEVTVDGVTATIGTKVSKGQKVVFCGKPIKKDEQLVLIAFHKPQGIVCTTDKREKDNIIDFIQYGKRIYPIGRLDKDSEGLILLTNDGNIVNKILRAGNNHEKEYIVTLNKPITSEFLKGMAAGVPILDTVTRPCSIKALDKFTFQIILTQGLNRQIRRMCEYFDYKVLTLKRIRIMNINLGYLQLGGYRNVTEKEIEGLKELMGNSLNTPLQSVDEYKQENDRITPESKHVESIHGNSVHADSNHKKYGTSRHKTSGQKPKKDYYHKGKKPQLSRISTLVKETSKVEHDKDLVKKEFTGKESDKFKKTKVKVSGSSNKKSYKSEDASKRKASIGKSVGSIKRTSEYGKLEIPPKKGDSNTLNKNGSNVPKKNGSNDPKKSTSYTPKKSTSSYGKTEHYKSKMNKTSKNRR